MSTNRSFLLVGSRVAVAILFWGCDAATSQQTASTVAQPTSSKAEREARIGSRLAHIPLPAQDADAPFLMPVEDVFSIVGRGTVATGKVARGRIKVGDEIEIVGLRQSQRRVATGVEMFRKLLDGAVAGDNIGVLVRGAEKADIQRGQVLAAPGSIASDTRFTGEVYLLTRDEGGRDKPFASGHRPQFYLWMTDVNGTVTLPGNVKSAVPGERVTLEVELSTPVALERGLRFEIRESGRTVGVGAATQLRTSP